MAAKLENLQTCNDLIVKHGHALQVPSSWSWVGVGIVRVGCDSSEVIKIPNFSAPPLPIASGDQTQEDIRNKRVSFCQL